MPDPISPDTLFADLLTACRAPDWRAPEILALLPPEARTALEQAAGRAGAR